MMKAMAPGMDAAEIQRMMSQGSGLPGLEGAGRMPDMSGLMKYVVKSQSRAHTDQCQNDGNGRMKPVTRENLRSF